MNAREGRCGPRGTRRLAVTGKLPLPPPFRETGRFLGEDPPPPDLTLKRVHFQYHCVAPARPCVVAAVNGHALPRPPLRRRSPPDDRRMTAADLRTEPMIGAM